MPDSCHAIVDADYWPFPHIFELLRDGGNIAPEEMARTFNCGVGMAAIVSATHADEVVAALDEAGETVHRIGEIARGTRGCTVKGPGGTWGSSAAWAATHDV